MIEFSSVAMDNMMYPALVGLMSSPPISRMNFVKTIRKTLQMVFAFTFSRYF